MGGIPFFMKKMELPMKLIEKYNYETGLFIQAIVNEFGFVAGCKMTSIPKEIRPNRTIESDYAA